MKIKLLFGLVCFAPGAWAGERFKTPAFIARQREVHEFITALRSSKSDITPEDISEAFATSFKLAPGSEREVLSWLYDAEALALNFGSLDEKGSWDRYKHVLDYQAFYLAAAFEELSVGA